MVLRNLFWLEKVKNEHLFLAVIFSEKVLSSIYDAYIFVEVTSHSYFKKYRRFIFKHIL